MFESKIRSRFPSCHYWVTTFHLIKSWAVLHWEEVVGFSLNGLKHKELVFLVWNMQIKVNILKLVQRALTIWNMQMFLEERVCLSQWRMLVVAVIVSKLPEVSPFLSRRDLQIGKHGLWTSRAQQLFPERWSVLGGSHPDLTGMCSWIRWQAFFCLEKKKIDYCLTICKVM